MKIAVSVGHTLTGIGSGAVGILNESICTREVADKFRGYLQSLGHEVVFLRIDSSTYSSYDYVTRAAQANTANVDLFVEIHLNSGGGHGTEVFAVSPTGRQYAQKVVDKIASLGYTNRGVKDGGYLYVLKHTDAPAILVECCFVDSQEDASRYNADALGKAIAEGITGQTANGSQTDHDIIWIQTQLNKCYYKLTVDGVMGPLTLGAIRDFQRSHGLVVDGIVGPKTIAALERV